MNSENKTTATAIKKGPRTWVRLFWKYYLIAAGVFLLFILMLNFGWIGDMPDLDDIENPQNEVMKNQSTFARINSRFESKNRMRFRPWNPE